MVVIKKKRIDLLKFFPRFKKKSKVDDLRKKDIVKHETKRKPLIKFILVLSVVIVYWLFISTRYGRVLGAHVTLLTWSLFVLCTPIASAGLLFDLPIRLLTKIRMFYVEMMVWFFAIMMNLFSIVITPDVYETTVILSILKHILITPIPFWSIMFVSAAGTFISIRFADELLDVTKEKHRKYYLMHEGKHTLIIFAFIILTVVLTYTYMFQEFGLEYTLF